MWVRRNKRWSGRRDSNSRPIAPKATALPDCATPRFQRLGNPNDWKAQKYARSIEGWQSLFELFSKTFQEDLYFLSNGVKNRQGGKPDSVLRRGGVGHLSNAINPKLKRGGPPLVPYLILLRTGFTLPPRLPLGRWALTPPFQPYPLTLSAFKI